MMLAKKSQVDELNLLRLAMSGKKCLEPLEELKINAGNGTTYIVGRDKVIVGTKTMIKIFA